MAKITRDMFMQAAGDLYWRYGYAAVSVDDICKSVGAQKGSFYNYYPSKAAMAIEMLDTQWADDLKKFSLIFSPQLAPQEQLKLFVSELIKYQQLGFEQFKCVVGCPFMSMMADVPEDETELKQKLLDIFNAYMLYFVNLIKQAKKQGLTSVKSPEQAAQRAFAYINGVLYHAKVMNDLNFAQHELLSGLELLLEFNLQKGPKA